MSAVRVRKRPVEHQAILYTGTNCNEVAEFLGCEWRCEGCDGDDVFTVETMHGPVEAKPGDWILLGERDAWPVDAEQFEATYEVLG